MNMYIEFIKMLAALAVVLGLFLLLMRLFKHKMLPRHSLITMLHYQPFGPKRGIALVKIAGEYFALGMADGGISVITKIEASKVEDCLKETQVSEAALEGFNLKKMLQDILPWRK